MTKALDRFRAIAAGFSRVALLLAMYLVLPSTWARAQAAFPTIPAWQSGPAGLTRSIAIGDVDRDGALDLVAGNLGQVNTLYLNNGETFASGPAWSSGQANLTFSVALGDVDGDGDLDLVCGNSVQSNTLYLNEGGTFAADPVWGTAEANFTSAVALGDIDGDTWLDIVCGNFGQANTLHLNSGGSLSVVASWSTAASDSTTALALGDVDGDGDLDLVCGNFGVNKLYVNSAGVLDTLAVWSSAVANRTTGVALGDVDGDGDLDLVCSNLDQPNTAYENLGATFATTPMWSSAPAGSSQSVALGDVDYDGDLDLVFANEDHPNTVYLNVGGPGVFETNPAWYSTPSNATVDVLLADIDRDGDLDIVAANSNQPNTAYANQSPPFPPGAGWFSNPSNGTLGIAVGDIDRDGDADLVCGNSGVNTAYRNDGRGFEQAPAWVSGPAAVTADVALGDVNGDGYPDLACGNAENPGQANALYLNQSGTFGSTPAWSSEPANRTVAIALGDLDGDGRIDLACGNAGQSNTVYLARDGTFETMPSWSSIPANPTSDVALGDLDGDGDLDLVCGNAGESNTLYRNNQGVLESFPSWSSGPANDTGGIALGDVDGDGDLDLACGNVGQSNTLYVNEGGTFGSTPVWSSEPTNRTSAVALEDVDGDGDLDLICSNLSQANTVYINHHGTLSTTPIWRSSAATESEDAAACDIDGDGDLDIVFGNELAPNTSYPGQKNPIFRGDPTDPTRHTPNGGAFVSSARTTETATNTVRLDIGVVDVESDPVWIAVQYQFEGEPLWRPATVGGAVGVVGPFGSSPSGTPDSLEWDITQVMFDSRDVILRLSVIEIPRSVSRIGQAATFLKNTGRVAPQRPQISPATRMLVFPTVTVGDTVALDLEVANSGNVDLVIDRVELPSAEMRSDVTGTITVAPQSSAVIRVFVAPVLETTIAGPVELSSNDPLTPRDSVLVSTDIRELRVTSRLLTPETIIPLGEAATVIVEPYPDVNVERGYLYHRPAGTQTFDAIPLGRSGGDFVAVVPGASVTEAGLEYYISVENAPVTSTDPPNAPDDSVYFRPVEQPQTVASTAAFTDPAGFLQGRGIPVLVELPQGAGFQGGTLHYRESAVQTWGHVELVADPVPSATIPDSIVGPRGVEYWVEVQTLTKTLTDPPSRPDEKPLSIPVIVPDLVEPSRHAAMTYRLFSIPLEMQGSILGSIADELGGSDVTRWRLFAYRPEIMSYEELPSDTVKTFRQGRSYWLISRGPHRIGSGPDRGVTAPTDGEFGIPLQPGYNLVADPFNFAVPWDSMGVDTLSMSEALGVLVEPPMAWVPGVGLYDSVAVLEPFDGYWVKNLSASTVTLNVPPFDAAASGANPVTARLAAKRPPPGWGIRIEAFSAGSRDGTGYAGVREGAKSGWDRFDRSKPPPAPGRSISVSFPHPSWHLHPGPYSHDVRGGYERLEPSVAAAAAIDDSAWGHVWRFDLAKSFTDRSGGDEVEMQFHGIEGTPEEAVVVLVDFETRRSVDLRRSAEYRFYEGRRSPSAEESDARFALVVGSESFVDREGLLPDLPTRTTLHQNHPNPFNPMTVIPYEVSAPVHVTIDVYDASGAAVRRLFEGHREPGVYGQLWDGKNDTGEQVASGMYFCRFEAGSIVETKKMVLLK